MCKNNKLITNFHFNADPPDPSNPFVHHAPDPSWKVLPERVKFPTLGQAEQLMNSRCRFHQTTSQHFSEAL